MKFLADMLRELPLSIEILPGDGMEWVEPASPNNPYRYEDGALGIPQRALYKSYMAACYSYSKAKKSAVRSVSTLLDSTSVILCANPAHQTALNTRKRLVLEGVLDPEWELKFTKSLLSFRDCTKEPILWHHRRWLLHRIHGSVQDPSCEITPWPLPSIVVNEEFAIVARGCDLYPRNYYAWAHRSFCMKSLSLSASSPFAESETCHPIAALIDEYKFMLYWIERHISDYSAMQYMCRLEKVITRLATSPSGITLPPTMPRLETHSQLLLRSYPDHESLWMYLRGSAPHVLPHDLPEFGSLATLDKRHLLKHLAWTAHQSRSLEFSESMARGVIGPEYPEDIKKKLGLIDDILLTSATAKLSIGTKSIATHATAQASGLRPW